MTSKQVREMTAIVREKMAGFQELKAAILADERYSDDYKRDLVRLAHQAAYPAAHAAARAGMGRGGAFWQARVVAQDAVRAARDAAELAAVPDVARLNLAISQLPTIMRRFINAGDFASWWQTAGLYDKLAVGYSEALLRQTNWVEAGSLVAQARDFRAARRDTADLQSALALDDDLDDSGIELANTIGQAAETFGDAATVPIFHSAGAEDSLAQIRANVERSDNGEWSLQEPRRYKTPVKYTINGPVGGDEGGEGGAPAE